MVRAPRQPTGVAAICSRLYPSPTPEPSLSGRPAPSRCNRRVPLAHCITRRIRQSVQVCRHHMRAAVAEARPWAAGPHTQRLGGLLPPGASYHHHGLRGRCAFALAACASFPPSLRGRSSPRPAVHLQRLRAAARSRRISALLHRTTSALAAMRVPAPVSRGQQALYEYQGPAGCPFRRRRRCVPAAEARLDVLRTARCACNGAPSLGKGPVGLRSALQPSLRQLGARQPAGVPHVPPRRSRSFACWRRGASPASKADGELGCFCPVFLPGVSTQCCPPLRRHAARVAQHYVPT